MEEAACKFEHGLRRGVDENICVLLGHPRLCPHGRQIPEGKCCREEIPQTPRIISKLSNVITGQEGDVAYLQTKDSKKIQRMISMGVLPGTRIKMIQTIVDAGFFEMALDAGFLTDDTYRYMMKNLLKAALIFTLLSSVLLANSEKTLVAWLSLTDWSWDAATGFGADQDVWSPDLLAR